MPETTLTVAKTALAVGLEKPVKLMHITDSHLCRAYPDEGEKLVALAAARGEKCFGGEENAERLFEQAVAYAKANADLAVFTGDIYDFLSRSNLEYMKKALDSVPYFYVAGNHDFCTAPGADPEDYPFKLRQLARVAPYVKDNLLMSSREIGGVNLVGLDDTYYQFTDGQTDFLRAEAAKGLPILLFLHNPLYTPRYAETCLASQGCAYLVGCPEEVLERYREPARAVYQRPNEATKRAVDCILHEPLIKAVFCGHSHHNFEEPLSNGVPQITTGGTFRGEARLITVE